MKVVKVTAWTDRPPEVMDDIATIVVEGVKGKTDWGTDNVFPMTERDVQFLSAGKREVVLWQGETEVDFLRVWAKDVETTGWNVKAFTSEGQEMNMTLDKMAQSPGTWQLKELKPFSWVPFAVGAVILAALLLLKRKK